MRCGAEALLSRRGTDDGGTAAEPNQPPQTPRTRVMGDERARGYGSKILVGEERRTRDRSRGDRLFGPYIGR